MTTTVIIRVNGSYRTTVKQEGKTPIDVYGNFAGSPNPSGEMSFYLPHPANSKFEIEEVFLLDLPNEA